MIMEFNGIPLLLWNSTTVTEFLNGNSEFPDVTLTEFGYVTLLKIC